MARDHRSIRRGLKNIRRVLLPAMLVVASAPAAFGGEKPPRLQPTRIGSIGDSITQAFDSGFILSNPSESWVNGYFGFLEDLLGFEDVNSHNQRADAAFGVDSNVNGSENGADMADMVAQATALLSTDPYYVTVELGGNDVCQDDFASLPSPLDYVLDFIDGVMVLDPGLMGGAGGLTPGATVQVASVPDVKQLYDVGIDQQGALGIDCETIWLGTLIGFPCTTMLTPFGNEESRRTVQRLNLAYNQVLEIVVNIVRDASQDVYWEYTWSVWNHQIQPNEISSIDCFHPSSDGQRTISELVWSDGPFAAF